MNRGFLALGKLIKELGGKICPIRPFERPTDALELLEIVDVLQWLEDRAGQFLTQVQPGPPTDR